LFGSFRSGVPEARRHVDKRVLAIVDDDDQVRRSAARLLRSCGYRVHVFGSAEAFLAQDCEADCALVDIQLPGLSGLELERRMKRDCPAAAVVFITARDDAATVAAVRKARRPVLMKPFDDDELLMVIGLALGR
jgi:FixJ family two-component response regulator